MKAKVLFLILLSFTSIVAGAEQVSDSLRLDLELDNFLYYKSDSDFDGSKRLYQPQGNSEGILGTYMNSKLTLNITSDVLIFYEVELGTNIWSKNNPDIVDPISEDIFVLKHRQIYGSAEFLENKLRVRSGYMRITDPTGLFVNHWIGAFQFGFDVHSTKNFILFAQLPDFNYEGFTASTNNFANDRWLFALSSSFSLTDRGVVTVGWYSYYDDAFIKRSNLIHAPVLSYVYSDNSFKVILDGVFQFGVMQNASIGGNDVRELSYGLNLNISEKIWGLNLVLNGLYLSPDDKYISNTYNGGFYYSGKNRSSTIMLSEDELRDQYNNIDERLSIVDGPFYVMRAGLFLLDVKAEFPALGVFIPSLVLGTAFVSNRENTNDSSFVGVEADVFLKLNISHGWDVTGVIGVLFPGKAASSYINMYDINSVDTQYLGQIHINYRY
ncbi:MAG: hypothetical protein N2746_11510 [Deltaproteobacteria bacterium]|nr:hypothetical protein [Deltaproteobacteria bacterium]